MIDNTDIIVDKSNKGKWYIIQVASGKEEKIKNEIESLASDFNFPIYELFIPMEKVSEIKKGKKVTSFRKIYSGYIFIRLDLYDDENKVKYDIWNMIQKINGVMGFIGQRSDRKPASLLIDEVKNLMDQMNKKEEKAIPKISFEVGEMVRIKEGAFENFEGNVQEIDYSKGKLKVLVSIFGRSTPVELEFWQVEK